MKNNITKEEQFVKLLKNYKVDITINNFPNEMTIRNQKGDWIIIYSNDEFNIRFGQNITIREKYFFPLFLNEFIKKTYSQISTEKFEKIRTEFDDFITYMVNKHFGMINPSKKICMRTGFYGRGD